MIEIAIFFIGILILLGPVILALCIYRKPVASEQSDRTDKTKRRYYPLKRQKGTAISEFIIAVALCNIIMPVIPAFMIPIVFPFIKWWVGIIILECIGSGLVIIYYLVFVFDIAYIELDSHGLEIVHKKGKRELYSVLTFENFYENTVRVKYSTMITRGMIFTVNGKKKEVNLDYLGEEGFVVFKNDFEYFLKNGVLPVDESKLPTEESKDIDNSAANDFPNLKNYKSYIFTQNVPYSGIRESLKEYYELYSDPEAYELNYAIKEIKGTSWIRIEFTLRNQTPKYTPFWEYLNALIWLSDKTKILFAYVFSESKNHPPAIAWFDTINPAGDTVLGIMNKHYFSACLPEEKIVWKNEIPASFDYLEYLEKTFGFNRKYLDDDFAGVNEQNHNNHWTLRITNAEERIENNADLIGFVDAAIEEIENGDEEFIVLFPKEPVNNIAFVQARMDDEPDLMYIEAGFEEKNKNGFPKILCKGKMEPSEVLEICIKYYQEGVVNTDGWDRLNIG